MAETQLREFQMSSGSETPSESLKTGNDHSTEHPVAVDLQGSEPSTTHRRRDIDGLRGIAVLTVVGYHFFPDLVPGGYIGVDVFFVISGFVITALLLREQKMTRMGLLHFWLRRIRRLLPALIVVLIATMLIGSFVMWPAQYTQLGQSVTWSSLMLGNIYQWHVTDYFASEPTWNPLLNLWSLGVEEQFYLAWPIVMGALLILWWRRKRTTIAIVALAVTGAWILSAAWPAMHDQTLNSFSDVFYLPWFRAWELGIGALAAFLVAQPKLKAKLEKKRLGKSSRAGSIAYLALLIGLFVSLVASKSNLNPAIYALASVLITVALILFGTAHQNSDRISGNPFLLFFGKISYSLYLWHWPLLSLMLSAGIVLSLWSGLGLLSVSIVAALITWKYIENIFLSKKISWKLISIILTAMMIVAMAGLGISRSHGFPSRSSAVASELMKFSYDQNVDYRTGTCFVEQASGQATSSLRNCFENEVGKNNILLWGDSFAASFYQGLKQIRGPNTTLTQLTVAGCQPQLPKTTPVQYCRDLDELALNGIKEQRFNTIVLMGVWKESEAQPLIDLIREIKAVSDAKILVVGPLPQWTPSLPRAWSFREARTLQALPEYSAQGLIQEPFVVNEKLKHALSNEGVTYLDALNASCRNNECLVTTDGTVQGLTSWDYAHLTKAGSLWLAQALLAGNRW